MSTPQTLPRKSLRHRTLSSGAWAVGWFGFSNALRLASNLILTRLLAPEAFGLMAIAISLHVWLSMMSDLGVKASIIRSGEGDDERFLATAWTMQAARSALIAFGLVVLAGIVAAARERGFFGEASVYADERLPSFLLIVAAAVFIGGFQSVKMAVMERQLTMSRVVALSLAAQVISIISTISLAAAGLGAYSLVLGMIVNSAVTVAGSFLVLRGPSSRFGFDRRHFGEIFGYGKWLLIASFFGFIVNRGDQVIFGYYLEETPFSLYAIAGIWITTIKTLFQQVLHRVAYPVFAELGRERPHDRTRIYYRFRLATDCAAVAAFLSAWFFSDEFFQLLYTEQYHGVADFVRLMAVGLVLIPYNLLNTALLASGDSRRFTAVAVVAGTAMVTGVPLLFRFVGTESAIVYAAVISLASLPFTWRYASAVVVLKPWREAIMAALAIVLAAYVILS